MMLLLLTKYADIEGIDPSTEWDPAKVTAHMERPKAVNKELAENSELVEVMILGGPDLATIVGFNGVGAPMCTHGPFPESKELLAGIQIIDVESQVRAHQIAAKLQQRRDQAVAHCPARRGARTDGQIRPDRPVTSRRHTNNRMETTCAS